MANTKNSKAKVGHLFLGVLISSMLGIVGNQNLFALTSGDRYNSGFTHGEQQAAIDFENNSPFNPVCVKHTTYYCAGYFKGYNITWNNLAKGQTSNPNPSTSNSTASNPLASNINSTTKPLTTSISSPTTDRWVWVVSFVVIIIAAIAWNLKRRKGKYRERQHFPDSVKEKVLQKQHHRCADCSRVLNVVDWHHKNGDRSDNRESNCVALCPNCHAIKTRRH